LLSDLTPTNFTGFWNY